jgi:uncharacterized protein (DUF983 family)
MHGWKGDTIRRDTLKRNTVGSVVLAMFLPAHIAIWSKFPVWYHLTFLLTIIPAVLVGALLPRRRAGGMEDVSRA